MVRSLSTLGTLWKLVVSKKTTNLKEMIPRNIQHLPNCSGRGIKSIRLGVVAWKQLEMLLSFEILGMSTFCLLTKLSRTSWTTGNGHLLWVLRSLQTDSVTVSQVRVSSHEPAEWNTFPPQFTHFKLFRTVAFPFVHSRYFWKKS